MEALRYYSNGTPYSSYSPSCHHETSRIPTQHQFQSQSKHVPTINFLSPVPPPTQGIYLISHCNQHQQIRIKHLYPIQQGPNNMSPSRKPTPTSHQHLFSLTHSKSCREAGGRYFAAVLLLGLRGRSSASGDPRRIVPMVDSSYLRAM